MQFEPAVFYPAVLGTGAILSGFCGTFLSFRIQQEANYYRQPVLDFDSEKAKDVYIGLSHFTSSFLLLIVAWILSLIFGVTFPLLVMAGAEGIFDSPAAIVAGVLAGLVFICGYFVCELVHYGILNSRLLNDPHEWGRASGTVISTFVLGAVVAGLVVWLI